MSSREPDSGGILLLSLPWRLSGWPSTALGSLKSYLSAAGVEVTALHLHMEVACAIGIDRYQLVAERAWDLAETFYSCLLAPDERDRLLGPAVDKLREAGQEKLAEWAATSAVEELRDATRNCLERIDLTRYRLAGFSVGALQLCSSLYAARLLKQRAPGLPVLFGGSGLVGKVGRNLLEAEPAIDALVDGEGEEALLRIARLGTPLSPEDLATVPNLWYRAGGEIRRTATEVLADLDPTPVPDYSDYFTVAERLGYPTDAMTLPVEASRGCAWEHRCGPEELRGCTFCGLYRTSPDYREKSLGRLLTEVEELVRQSQLLDLGFIDAYLPQSYRRELLAALAGSPRDLTVWCELRCNLDEEVATLLALAGAWKVQLGVEALHTPILKRMEKGTRAIENIYCVRLCEERGIQAQYNLLTHYPGVPRREVEEMIALLPQLFGYRPPQLSEFYLDRGSRIYRAPREVGLTPGDLDHVPAAHLPSALAGCGLTQLVPFRLDPVAREAVPAWEELARVVDRWQQIYRQAVRAGHRLPLSYREGHEILEVIDCRSGEQRTLRFGGALREVFLACRKPVSLSQLAQQLPHLDPARLKSLVGSLAAQQLIFQEGQLCLSLPARATLPNGLPRLAVARPEAVPTPFPFPVPATGSLEN